MSQRDLLLKPVSNTLPYFPADFHANPLVLPGSEKARSITVFSGRKCSGLLKSPGPLGFLEKTLMESSVWNSTMRLLIWNISVTPAGRSIFRLSPLVPGIADKEYSLSLLPTPDTAPNAPNKNTNRKYPKNLLQAAREKYSPIMFPTPRNHETGAYQYSQGDHKKKTPTLTGAVRLFPTPNALNGHNSGTFQEWGGATNKLRGTELASGNVNPDWEEWLMGFPPGWTRLSDKSDAELSEMLSSRNKSIRSSKQLQT